MSEEEKNLTENPTEAPQNEEVTTKENLEETPSQEEPTENEETAPVVEEPTAEAPVEEEGPIDLTPADEEDDDDWWKDEDEYTDKERKELEALYAGTMREFQENDIVNGIVASIGEKEVVLNIGFKSEGIVPISEFRDIEDLAPGKEVEVLIETVEDQDGQLVLSRKRAKNLRTWERINASMDEDVVLEGMVMRRTKGGFVVDLSGIEAFLPGSQIDVKPVRDFDAYVGRTMEFKVVKINHAYENVVVSHKVLIEEKLDEQRKEILANLEKGQVLEGSVKNMTNFGVFIDLGGVDGLLHITDISWGRINHPEEKLNLDEKVNVVVLDFDDAKKRISLGMKQLTPHPWDSLPETIVEGSIVKGRVVTVADYGLFLEIMAGVEGLIHTSEMSWSQYSKNPSESYKEGDQLEAKVLSLDREERKMSLGLKQLKDDPWAQIQEKYPVNSRHTGTVRNILAYGLFVELEEGVDGLVHISDLSWTKKFNHPSDFVKVDEKIEVVVLGIDMDTRRLSLGHKQLTEDVWETFASIFTVGSSHKGTIKKIDNRGATVELDYGIEGQCSKKNLKVEEGKPELKVDDQADFVVVEFNKDAKRLTLSHVRTWKADEPKASGKSSGGGSGKPKAPPKAGTTSLGEFDALAKLKEKMEAEEKGGTTAKKKAAPKKKEEAPKEEEPKAEEVKVEEPKAEETPAEEPKAEEKPKKKTTKAKKKKEEEPAEAEAPAEEKAEEPAKDAE